MVSPAQNELAAVRGNLEIIERFPVRKVLAGVSHGSNSINGWVPDEFASHKAFNALLGALGIAVEDLFVTIDDIYIGSEAPAYPLLPKAN